MKISASLRLLVTLTLLSSGVGCISTRYAAPHQVYAPLLDHRGQMDIAVRAGAMERIETTVAVQAAYAPIDNLEVAVNVDVDPVTSGSNTTQHVGGGLAIGVFSDTEVFRVEGMIGVNGGSAWGDGSRCAAFSSEIGLEGARACTMSTRFALHGPYLQPFIQGFLAFEQRYFEFAGGLRLFGFFSDVLTNGTDGSTQRNGYERLYIEPVVTVRVPIEFIRFEVLAALPMRVLGDLGPMGNDAGENGFQGYLTGGIAVQFDTMGAPAR